MATTKWTLDTAHSELQFKVKHLMITNVTGHFKAIEGSIEAADDNFSNAKIDFKADLNTVSTNNDQRDGHLKSADFFDTEKYPELKFESTSYDASHGKISGNLTIKDVTQPVTLDVEFHGVTKDPWGNAKAGFSISGKINRKDWGLNYNAALETGGVLLSEDVKVIAEVQFAKAA
ncbi:MAG: YceI family protein [Chitinophagaceae bacterium]